MSSKEDRNTLKSNGANGIHDTTTMRKRYIVKKRRYKLRIDLWERMIKIKFDKNGKVEKARCSYCLQEYLCVFTNDTSALGKYSIVEVSHLMREIKDDRICPFNPWVKEKVVVTLIT